MAAARKPYPSDVSDEEWALVAPYLTLLPESAGQGGVMGWTPPDGIDVPKRRCR